MRVLARQLSYFSDDNDLMAEREGFEPPVGFPLRRFSRPEPSTTRPPLRLLQFYYSKRTLQRRSQKSTPVFKQLQPLGSRRRAICKTVCFNGSPISLHKSDSACHYCKGYFPILVDLQLSRSQRAVTRHGEMGDHEDRAAAEILRTSRCDWHICSTAFILGVLRDLTVSPH